MDLNRENLFSILQIGDRQVEQLKQHLCMIVGLTKNGKSCFFNHLLARPMQGARDPEDPQRIIYTPKLTTASTLPCQYATMGSSPVSVTLAPNIADLSSDCSLIDMLGFQQNRNEKSVLCVSYFLLSCFQKAVTARFIVVVASENLLCRNLDFLCGSFNELVEMFDLARMGSILKKRFLDSVALVVSCATQTLDYYKTRLSTIVNQLANRSLETIKNRQLIKDMLQRVVATGRVQCFLQAQEQQPSPLPTILKTLESTSWQAFEVRRAKESMGGQAIVIPFKEDFSKLPPLFMVRFRSTLNAKIEGLIGISSVFEVYMAALRENWAQGKIHMLDLSKVRAAISNCLREELRYHKDALIKRKVAVPENNQQDAFAIVRKSVEIYRLRKQLQTLWEGMQKLSFDTSMSSLSQLNAQMVDCLVPAFTDRQALGQLAELKFILQRCAKQFTKFNRLDPELISNSNIIVRTKDENATNVALKDHLALFTAKINATLLKAHFYSFDCLTEYEEIVELCRQAALKDLREQAEAGGKGQLLQLFQIRFKRMLLPVYQLRVELSMQPSYRIRSEKWAMLFPQIRLIQLLVQLYTLTASSQLLWSSDYKMEDAKNDYLRKANQSLKNKAALTCSPAKIVEGNRSEKIEEAYYHTARAINRLVESATAGQGLAELASTTPLLLQLCDLTRSAALADRIYEQAHQEELAAGRKLALLTDHAAHCQKHGWLEKARVLLGRKIEHCVRAAEYEGAKQALSELQALAKARSPQRALLDGLGSAFSEAELSTLKRILDKLAAEARSLGPPA